MNQRINDVNKSKSSARNAIYSYLNISGNENLACIYYNKA